MAKKKDALTQRMKQYENEYKYNFYVDMDDAIVIRIDGKNCSNWTRNFKKPYDWIFATCMTATLKYLVENVPNCVVGWTHSDELSIVLKLPHMESELWYGGSLQKLVSITASMATMKFNQEFYRTAVSNCNKRGFSYEEVNAHSEAALEGLVFDSRAFIIPWSDVPNYLLCRQRDCIRNSIEGAARQYFSHNEIQGKNGTELKLMLMENKGVDWEKDYPNDFQYGVLAYRTPKAVESKEGITYRHEWKLTEITPVLNYWNQSFLGEDYYEQVKEEDSDMQGREPEEKL